MSNSNQSCSLQLSPDVSEFSKRQLQVIKDRIKAAETTKAAVIFANLLSFFTRSSAKKALAAKGSVDVGNIKLAINSLNKATLKMIETDASLAVLRTKGAESKAWREILVCIRSKM